MKATIGNKKGGVAKTTTTVHLALGLARQGHRVLIADGDVTNRSCLRWKSLADDWPASVSVMGFGDDLARSVQAIAGDYDSVLIDTSPQHDRVLRQALMVTDDLIIPVAPSPMELEQLPDTFAVAADVDVTSPVTARVLLVMVTPRTHSLAQARAWLTDPERSLPVMTAEVHRLEAYKLAYGSVPSSLGQYADVLAELTADNAAEVA